ncbi:MAG: universal stress protein [Pseudomonadota bacterium]
MRQFSNILYVVPDEDPQAGLDRAVSLAQADGAVLTLVSVVETMVSAASAGRFHDELAEAFEALRRKRLERLRELAAGVKGSVETVCEVMDGLAYLKVIKRVQLYKHDLVVAHTAGHGGPMARLFVSEEMQLLRKCPCPVLLLKPLHQNGFDRIVATVDFDHQDDPDGRAVKTALNADIVDLAATLAEQDRAKLDVLNIFTVPGEASMVAGWIPMTPENLSDYAKRCRGEAETQLQAVVKDSRDRTGLDVLNGEDVTTHIVKGRPRVEIPHFVREHEADLVVMGTVGRVGVPGFLIGNTAETILTSIDCSVLALKPHGFESPVTVD